MKKARKVMKVIIILLIAFIIVLVAIYINHRIQLNKEEALRTPLGKLVEVDGHQMSVYVEGNGDKTIVFLSGGGTCSPILDFKSLYATLSDDYRIVVVEKFGYGFSDVVDKERGIASILEDTRTALAKADIQGTYVLCPHSMSGIEALYWAQQYPEEVEAIVGLDMAVPGPMRITRLICQCLNSVSLQQERESQDFYRALQRVMLLDTEPFPIQKKKSIERSFMKNGYHNYVEGSGVC